MLGSNLGGLVAGRRLTSVACVGVLSALVIACAASTTSMHTERSSAADVIADVRVERDATATVVTLLGLKRPVYTAFQQPDPDRVVIDLASVHPQNGGEPIEVYDGLVQEVTFSPFSTGTGDAMTRVEVSLAAPAEYEVLPSDEGLVIRVKAAGGTRATNAALGDDWDAADDAGFAAADSEDGEDPAAVDPWAIAPAAFDTDGDDPSADTEQGEADAWNPTLAAEVTPAFEASDKAATPATTLVSIDAREVGQGTLIHLQADGTLESAVTFSLEDPDRLVIDLPGMRTSVASEKIAVDSAHAARVRVGQHADMVRVVVDAGSAEGAFDGRRVLPARGGLVVALGAGAQLEAAVAQALTTSPQGGVQMAAADQAISTTDQVLDTSGWAVEPAAMGDAMDEAEAAFEVAEQAPAKLEEAAIEELEDEISQPLAQPDWQPELASQPMDDVVENDFVPAAPAIAPQTQNENKNTPAKIYGVEFDTQGDHDRIVVLGESPVDYFVYEPDPETLVLSITDATIEPEAAVRIAPAPGGPVSLVTAFEQPDVATSEVRVVVKRAAGLKPEVTRRGTVLVIDFPRGGDIAAMPPVLADEMAAGNAFEPAMQQGTQTAAAEMPAAPAPAAAPMGAPMMGAPMSDNRSVSAAPGFEAAPASLEPPAAIAILNEGGLMDGKEYTGRRISLDFKDVDVADVLRLIAEVSDLNVIAGDEVKGQVTIRLVDVPWDQALDVILLTKGLGFMRVGNVLRIAPAGVIKSEEESRLQERRAQEKLEDLVVKLQPVNYAAVKDVKKMVTQLLSPRGSVNADDRTNTLIIKDIASVVDEATALVKAIDTQTPQVMIEAKIVEASLDFSREFGSTWGFGAQPLVNAFDSSSGARQDLGSDGVRFHNSANSDFFGNNAVFSNPITAGPTGIFNLATFLLDEKLNLELQLQAAEVNGDGKVISSPRIVTLDNSKASIEQGVSIPFQTFENGDAQLEFIDAVLELEVTPHITADRSIIMEIQVSRNAPDDSVFTLTGSPAIAKNEVETETLVKDGQTLVLGGIYVVDKSQRQSRVPYLHRIPFLGAAFRNDEISDSRKELLVFVTPRIVVNPQTGN